MKKTKVTCQASVSTSVRVSEGGKKKKTTNTSRMNHRLGELTSAERHRVSRTMKKADYTQSKCPQMCFSRVSETCEFRYNRFAVETRQVQRGDNRLKINNIILELLIKQY